jgi:phosphoribosylanthranilate isomerase
MSCESFRVKKSPKFKARGMEKIKLKVCGMRDEKNILEVGILAPDFMGFIFYEKSPRFVGSSFQVPSGLQQVSRVGVFVNETTDAMLLKAKDHMFEYLQLHGRETVEQCAELKESKIKVIKAFAVGDEMDFTVTKPYAEVCEYFLFDTKGKNFGGNGHPFNWKVLHHYDQRVPFFLSGGIGPENVNDVKALNGLNLYALDVNSGVEETPGVKNYEKIKRLKDILYSNN